MANTHDQRIPLNVIAQRAGGRLPVRQGTKPVGRPRGEIRAALGDAARWFEQQRSLQPLLSATGAPVVGATRFELLHKAQVGRPLGRRTLDNMVRAGELVHAGAVRIEGHARPLTLYAPAPEPSSRAVAGDLAGALAQWWGGSQERAIG